MLTVTTCSDDNIKVLLSVKWKKKCWLKKLLGNVQCNLQGVIMIKDMLVWKALCGKLKQ